MNKTDTIKAMVILFSYCSTITKINPRCDTTLKCEFLDGTVKFFSSLDDVLRWYNSLVLET